MQEKKHARVVEAMEHRLMDLGLSGKIVRLALFRDPDEAIVREVRSGVKTVVVVGNDQTVHRVADVVVGTGVVLALIPLGEPRVFAQLLGVPYGIAACDILAQRIVESMDVGLVNGHRFFTGVSVEKGLARVEAPEGYSTALQSPGALEVRNLTAFIPESPEDVGNPTDGKLEVILEAKVRQGWGSRIAQTKIPLASCRVLFPKPVEALVDGVPVIADTFDFSVDPGALRVVVGRERWFNT